MKIELSNGVVVIPTPEIAVRVKQIIFEEIDNCPAWPEEALQPGDGAKKAETKLSAKFRRKFEEKEEVKIKKGGYTDAEIQNIIAMYNLGDSPKAIGKKIGKPASAISTKLWNLKREGRIQERKKPELPPDDQGNNDGFKTL